MCLRRRSKQPLSTPLGLLLLTGQWANRATGGSACSPLLLLLLNHSTTFLVVVGVGTAAACTGAGSAVTRSCATLKQAKALRHIMLLEDEPAVRSAGGDLVFIG